MTKSELAYKLDTGFDPTFYVGSESMRSENGYGPKHDYCDVGDFPNEYVIDSDVYIPDPAYVRWLE